MSLFTRFFRKSDKKEKALGIHSTEQDNGQSRSSTKNKDINYRLDPLQIGNIEECIAAEISKESGIEDRRNATERKRKVLMPPQNGNESSPQKCKNEQHRDFREDPLSSALCFELGQDIKRMINLKWVMEQCNPDHEERREHRITVNSVCEFLERVEAEASKNGNGTEPLISEYELIDSRRVGRSKHEAMRYFRGKLLPARLCSMLEQDIDEFLNVYRVLMNNNMCN